MHNASHNTSRLCALTLLLPAAAAPLLTWCLCVTLLNALLFHNTGVSMELLKTVGNRITTIPEGFHPHKQIAKVYDARKAMIDKGAQGLGRGAI